MEYKEEEGERPGPLNQWKDMGKVFMTVQNVIMKTDSEIGINLQVFKEGKYKVLPHEAWVILRTKYGIGTMIGNSIPNDVVRLSDSEAHYRYFRIKTIPNIQYNKGVRFEPKKIYISQFATVNEFHSKICEYLASLDEK